MITKLFQCRSGNRAEVYLRDDGIGLTVSGVNLPPCGAMVSMDDATAAELYAFIGELLRLRRERHGEANGRAA